MHYDVHTSEMDYFSVALAGRDPQQHILEVVVFKF
jgi:hypothetical protein